MNKNTSGQAEFTASPGRSDTGSRGVSMGTELWLGESVDDMEKMKCSQYGWYGMDNFNSTTCQNKSNEWIIRLGHTGFTTSPSRSSTCHSVCLRILNYDWVRARMKRWDVHRMVWDGWFQWYRETMMVQVMLYKICNNRIAKRGFTIVFIQVRKASIHN